MKNESDAKVARSVRIKRSSLKRMEKLSKKLEHSLSWVADKAIEAGLTVIEGR